MRRSYLAVFLIVLGACDRGGADRAELNVARDSAGVRIVENAGPASGSAAWSVSPEPVLVIGQVDGDLTHLFHQIPHPGVARLSDGSIVVADGASKELRYFDAAGEHLGTAGGEGAGPGEFRTVGALLDLRADSAFVLDHFAARISVFGPDGRFVRSISLRDLDGFVLLVMLPFGFGPDGSLLIRGQPPDLPAGFGPSTVTTPLFRTAPGSAGWTAFAEIPATVLATDEQGRGRPIFPAVHTLPRTARGGVWVAVPTRSELQRTNWDGALDRIIRFTDLDLEVTPGERARILAWHAETMSGLPEAARAMVAEAVVQSHWPAFGVVLVGPEQTLWVQEVVDDRDPAEWEFATPRGSSRWRVVDSDGVWITTVDLPDGFVPHVIGEDYLLGVWKDAAETEFVHLYRLVRG